MPWIEANGASLRYELSGSGKETLVLMHEAGGCLESYEDALPGLEKEFRVLRYDQRGFGFSEKARELTLRDRGRGPGRAPRCAEDHRAGARGRLRDGQRFCGRIRRASSRAGREARRWRAPTIGSNAERSGPILERAALVEREGIRAAMKASHDRSYPENLRAPDPERFRRFRARWVCNTPASFMASARMMSAMDLTPEYAKIEAPTLVIGAMHDTQRPPEMAQRVANAIRGAQYVLADTGHFMNVETPQLYAETIVPFFKGR